MSDIFSSQPGPNMNPSLCKFFIRVNSQQLKQCGNRPTKKGTYCWLPEHNSSVNNFNNVVEDFVVGEVGDLDAIVNGINMSYEETDLSYSAIHSSKISTTSNEAFSIASNKVTEALKAAYQLEGDEHYIEDAQRNANLARHLLEKGTLLESAQGSALKAAVLTTSSAIAGQLSLTQVGLGHQYIKSRINGDIHKDELWPEMNQVFQNLESDLKVVLKEPTQASLMRAMTSYLDIVTTALGGIRNCGNIETNYFGGNHDRDNIPFDILSASKYFSSVSSNKSDS